jgi:hypothetical protein
MIMKTPWLSRQASNRAATVNERYPMPIYSDFQGSQQRQFRGEAPPCQRRSDVLITVYFR